MKEGAIIHLVLTRSCDLAGTPCVIALCETVIPSFEIRVFTGFAEQITGPCPAPLHGYPEKVVKHDHAKHRYRRKKETTQEPNPHFNLEYGGSMETKNCISKQDHTKKTIFVDGYEVVAAFSDERKPETFQTVRRILLSAKTEKKAVDAA